MKNVMFLNAVLIIVIAFFQNHTQAIEKDVSYQVLRPFIEVVHSGKTHAEVTEQEMNLMRMLLSNDSDAKDCELELIKYMRQRYVHSIPGSGFRENIYSSSDSRGVVTEYAIVLLFSKKSPAGLIEYTKLTGQSIDVPSYVGELGVQFSEIEGDLKEALMSYEIYSLIESMNQSRLDFYINGAYPDMSSIMINRVVDISERYGRNKLVDRLIVNYMMEYDSVFKISTRVNRKVYASVPDTAELLSDCFIRLSLDSSDQYHMFNLIKDNFSQDVFDDFCVRLMSSEEVCEEVAVAMRNVLDVK